MFSNLKTIKIRQQLKNVYLYACASKKLQKNVVQTSMWINKLILTNKHSNLVLLKYQQMAVKINKYTIKSILYTFCYKAKKTSQLIK